MVNDKALEAAAALVVLARYNIPVDVQELLVSGDPMRGIRPGALAAAITAAKEGREPAAWLHPTANWANVDKSFVEMHCLKDGPQPIALYTHPLPSPPLPREARNESLPLVAVPPSIRTRLVDMP